MTDVPRIAPQEAHEKVEAGGALLVCAYAAPLRFQALQLEGSISLQEFRSHGRRCLGTRRSSSTAPPRRGGRRREAAKSMALGFSNSELLLGGVHGWKEAGYRLVSSA